MKNELIELYVKGMLEGCFTERGVHFKTFEGYKKMYDTEKFSNVERHKNPEWAEAQKVLNSPLMKALS